MSFAEVNNWWQNVIELKNYVIVHLNLASHDFIQYTFVFGFQLLIYSVKDIRRAISISAPILFECLAIIKGNTQIHHHRDASYSQELANVTDVLYLTGSCFQ